MSNRWPRRFVKADGERILWHILDYLRMYYNNLDEKIEPMLTIHNLISEVLIEQGHNYEHPLGTR